MGHLYYWQGVIMGHNVIDKEWLWDIYVIDKEWLWEMFDRRRMNVRHIIDNGMI